MSGPATSPTGDTTGAAAAPIARPTARPSDPTKLPIHPKESGPLTQLGPGNTPRHTAAWSAAPTSPERTGRHALRQLRNRLNERDLAVLRQIRIHRFLATHHITQLQFADHASSYAGERACRRCLKRLHELRLLRHLDRRVGGLTGGSTSFVWTLGAVGERLLRIETNERSRERYHEPSVRFVDHCLAIADLHVALVAAARKQQLDLIEVELEPACWRSFPGIGGEVNVLQPDLGVVTGAGDFEDHWMVEVDLGNEHVPTILKKCRQYLAYRDSGIEQRDGGVFPAVVWVMATQADAAKLAAAIAASRQLAADLFRVTTPAGFIDLIAGGAV